MNDVTRIMAGRSQPVAVLVDGENIAADHSEAILTHARNLGDPIVRRVYGNAALLAAWEKTPGYQFIHTSSGKNFADMRMTIDAMDLTHTQDMRRFVIASCDRDFTPLVLRLREMGATIFGYAREGCAFGTLCDSFHATPTVSPKIAPQNQPKPVDMAEQIFAELNDISRNAGIRITDLHAKMQRANALEKGSKADDFRRFLEMRSSIFACDKVGPKARVRLRRGAARPITRP